MNFSRRQQQVLGVCCLLYGIWLICVIHTEGRKTIESSSVSEPEASIIPFYIDPPVELNSADAEELQLLPDIGPILAERIVAYRERHGAFHSLNSLRNITGIGPKTVQKVRYYLILEENPKSEIRNPKQIQNSNIEGSKQKSSHCLPELLVLIFEF